MLGSPAMRLLGTILIHVILAGAALAQPTPKQVEGLAQGIGLKTPYPITVVGYFKSWFQKAKPFQIAGPIYYVGTEGLAAYLIDAGKEHGLILLDGAMPESAGAIEQSIRELGFDPARIRYLLITHAHIDHAGTVAHFKNLSKATVVVMRPDFDLLQSGGARDPLYKGQADFQFTGVTADKILDPTGSDDSRTIRLGDITMRAMLGAGHSPGATTWTTRIKPKDGGAFFDVLFPCCTTILPNYKLLDTRLHRATYSGIANDFERTFKMLQAQKPEIWLAAHTDVFGFTKKRREMAAKGFEAWRDPAGYAEFIEGDLRKFRRQLNLESFGQR